MLRLLLVYHPNLPCIEKILANTQSSLSVQEAIEQLIDKLEDEENFEVFVDTLVLSEVKNLTIIGEAVSVIEMMSVFRRVVKSLGMDRNCFEYAGSRFHKTIE